MKQQQLHKPPFPSTPQSAREWFRQNGVVIKDWCASFDLDRYVVTDLLRGQLKGDRGEAHRAAVLLGLKADPSTLRKAA